MLPSVVIRNLRYANPYVTPLPLMDETPFVEPVATPFEQESSAMPNTDDDLQYEPVPLTLCRVRRRKDDGRLVVWLRGEPRLLLPAAIE